MSGGAVAPGGGGAKVPSFEGADIAGGGGDLSGVCACAAATATSTAITVKARVRNLSMDWLSLLFFSRSAERTGRQVSPFPRR